MLAWFNNIAMLVLVAGELATLCLAMSASYPVPDHSLFLINILSLWFWCLFIWKFRSIPVFLVFCKVLWNRFQEFLGTNLGNSVGYWVYRPPHDVESDSAKSELFLFLHYYLTNSYGSRPQTSWFNEIPPSSWVTCSFTLSICSGASFGIFIVFFLLTVFKRFQYLDCNNLLLCPSFKISKSNLETYRGVSLSAVVYSLKKR